ncbi:uncharacterized protein LOC111863317 isoform X2 [Cryptotermes secundus]|nr:uncharacterized protein LOC111863317 isoform X2 [Cryptotermes secundus]
MAICKLPAEVQSALRSGGVITSMAQCVEELVLNAIDAGATSVAIRVHFKFHKIQVIDNGCGLNSAQLDLIGTRYMTSKCHSLEDLHNHLDQFGFRGEALASLREVSGLLTFESRPKGCDITYCKVFTHGKSHKAGISKTIRPGQGTTITVHDFMYNMPVRKQRIRSAIDLEEIKSHIECIALMHPQISFSLRNDTDGNIILHTRKCMDIIGAFSYLFGQTVAQSLVAVSSTLGQFKISGFISKEAHHQKNLQFIYVNKRLILKSKLHRLANSVLGNSFILKTNATSHDCPISKERSTGRWLAFSPPEKRDKYAVYLLNVECPYHLYDICLEPKKTLIEFCDWDEVLQCMETAIRSFLEKEYAVNFSQESSREKNNGNNISSLVKEMEQLEEEYALGQLKTQRAEPTEISLEGNSDTHNLSETVTRKMLNVSRAVFGMPAKRKDKNEDVCYEDNLCLQRTALTFEETDIASEITVVVKSGVNRNSDSALPVCTQTPALDKCGSENPFSCSEKHGATQQSKTPLTCAMKSSARHTGRRNLNHSVSDLSDIPSVESNCEKSSVPCRLTETDSDFYPTQRFRNFINLRTQPKCRSECIDLPPITKFRETFHCISDIQIPMPLKKFEFNSLLQYLGTSQLMKECLNGRNKCDKPSISLNLKDVTVGGSETAQKNVCRYKGANGILSSRVSANLKCLLEGISKKHAEMRKVFNKVHSKGHNNYKLLIDRSVQHPSVQDASKTMSSINVAKPITQCENTENTEAAIFKFEKNIFNWSTGFSYQSLKAKDASNIGSSSSFRGPVCNEFNIPHRKIMEVEECAQTFDLASTLEAEKVEKLWSSTPHRDHAQKTTDKHVAGRDISLIQNNNDQVHNQLEIIYPKINVQKYDTNIYSENNSSSKNYFTSSDFLCTLERERVKKMKFTTQNSIPVCQATDFQNEHCANARAFNCSKKSHNIQAYRKTVRFSPSDKRIFNSNAEGSTVQLFSSPSNSDCVVRSVSVVEECVRPDLGAVTCRLSPKLDFVHQLGCRNVLTFLNTNSDMVCDGKLMKNNIQHSDYMKNRHVDNCTEGIPRMVLSSDCAVPRQLLGNNMIFSSGNEADVESCTETEPCSRKRRRVTILSFNNIYGNKRFSRHKINQKYLYQQARHINGSCSEDSLKRKICYPIEKCESWKWNMLAKELHGEGASVFFQGQENCVRCLSSDRQRSRSRLVDESPQMSVHERVSQILDGSNDTIASSSCSSYNPSLSHFHRTDNCKMIISDSSSDLSLNKCNVTCSEVPGNLPCVPNRLAVSSNGNETESEMCCSQLLSDAVKEMEITAGNDVFISCGQMDSSEVGKRTVGVLESHDFKETSSKNLSCENVCTKLSPIASSNVISTSKIACITELPRKEDNLRTVGNENNISETENIVSCEKSNIPLEIISPKVTIIQGGSENVYNETDKLDDASKNNSGSKSCEKEQSLFSKSFSSSNAVKCGVSSSYKCSENETSQLPSMKNISSEQGQLFASERLSDRNNEYCGASRNCSCRDGESTHLIAKEVLTGGKKCSDQEYPLVKESLSRNAELYGTSDTFSLLKKNGARDIHLANSGSMSNGPGHSPTNGTSPAKNNNNNGVTCSDKFTEVASAQTLRQDSIFNSENISKKQYGILSFFEVKQYNNTGGNESSDCVNIHDSLHENNTLHTDFITCGQLSRSNDTKSRAEYRVFSRDPQTEKGQNLNELLHPDSCTVTVGQQLRETQSHLLDRKRRSEIDCRNPYGKRNCLEKPSGNISMPKCKPYESNADATEVCMSNSISTQELNEAFDNIMSKIAESDTNKQENHVPIAGQDSLAAHTLGDSTVEEDVCKETDKRSHSPEIINIKCPKGWKEKLDPRGKKFFVHIESGLTSYIVPNQLMAQNLYSMSKRFAFLPKGMSPILENGVNRSHKESEERTLTPTSHQTLCNVITDSYSLVDELATVKWKDMQEAKGTDCRDLVKKLLADSDSRMQYCEKEVSNACAELPRSTVKVYNVLYPYTFSKDIFSNLQVLGQMDNKFIVTLVGPRSGQNQNVIVLFDQHAVHERIRLESLMKGYLVEGSDSEFRTVEVNRFITLHLSSKEVRILSSFREDFKRLGLQFDVVDDSSIQVTSVPACLLAREQREVQGHGISVLNGFLENMIREQVDSILSTRGVGIRLPTILQSVISSEACRGAVKFGDPLYPEECDVLLKNLSECQVPFQCAHGRPALVPIVDLQHIEQTQVRPKPQLWKLKKGLEKPSNL